MKKASKHEEVTARHAPPAGMVADRFARTTRFPEAELESLLRSESGLHAAVSPEEIARQMENDLKAMPPLEGRRPFSEIVPAPAPHARPTNVFPPITPGAGFAPAPEGLRIPTKPAQPSYPGWVIPAAIASVLVLVSATIALGFVLGRLSGQH